MRVMFVVSGSADADRVVEADLVGQRNPVPQVGQRQRVEISNQEAAG